MISLLCLGYCWLSILCIDPPPLLFSPRLFDLWIHSNPTSESFYGDARSCSKGGIVLDEKSKFDVIVVVIVVVRDRFGTMRLLNRASSFRSDYRLLEKCRCGSKWFENVARFGYARCISSFVLDWPSNCWRSFDRCCKFEGGYVWVLDFNWRNWIVVEPARRYLIPWIMIPRVNRNCNP